MLQSSLKIFISEGFLFHSLQTDQHECCHTVPVESRDSRVHQLWTYYQAMTPEVSGVIQPQLSPPKCVVWSNLKES